jgi:ATP-dependent Clp protease protease subunit
MPKTKPLKTQKIYLFDSINYTVAESVIRNIHEASEDKEIQNIELIICSSGGFLYPSFAIYDTVINSQKPINTLATGYCGSCGVMILQAGKKRSATQNTRFLIHPSEMSVEVSESYRNYLNTTEDYKQLHAKFMELSSQKTGYSPEEFEKLATPSKYLSPEEALEFGKNGLIDEIV